MSSDPLSSTRRTQNVVGYHDPARVPRPRGGARGGHACSTFGVREARKHAAASLARQMLTRVLAGFLALAPAPSCKVMALPDPMPREHPANPSATEAPPHDLSALEGDETGDSPATQPASQPSVPQHHPHHGHTPAGDEK